MEDQFLTEVCKMRIQAGRPSEVEPGRFFLSVEEVVKSSSSSSMDIFNSLEIMLAPV